MLAKEELLLIIYFILVIVLLTGLVMLFFVVYHNRKNRLLQENFEAKQRFEREISQSRIEMQEQTLKNVGWELHDNIGQLLAVAKMQLNMLARTVSPESGPAVKEVQETVGNSLEEVRSLSRSLNTNYIEHAGLETSLRNELDRFERLGLIRVSLEISGMSFDIPRENAIILFRIIQEFFSNVIKHSKATAMGVHLDYHPKILSIRLEDNGRGFDLGETEKSSGLLTMEKRAELLGAIYQLISEPGAGTELTLELPKTTN